MTIFNDSYQTTIGSAFVTSQIEHALNRSIISESNFLRALEVNENGEYKPLFVTGLLNSEAEIPLFTHPISIKSHRGEKFLCTDLRMYVNKAASSYDSGYLKPVVKNITEYNFAKSRGILNLIWLNEGSSVIKNNLSFSGVVFSAWLSEIISKTYALDFKDQTIIAIIASFYYQTLFTNHQEIDEDFKQKMSVHTIKATKAPADLVFQVFDKIQQLSNIEEFCKAVSTIPENVRLKDFNLAMLLTLIRNSWYGINAKEIISVSLEHPPTWNAIVYAALSERTFKTSSIYKIAERFGKRGVSDEFMNNYKMLVKDHLTPAKEELQLEKVN